MKSKTLFCSNEHGDCFKEAKSSKKRKTNDVDDDNDDKDGHEDENEDLKKRLKDLDTVLI